MKTTPDGWPVYEDTGDEIDCPHPLFIVSHDDGYLSEEVVIGVYDRTSKRKAAVATESFCFEEEDGARYFRHPHNAAAAWLKAVSGEDA